MTLLGLPAPATMTGRVLREAISDGPDPTTVAITPLRYSAEATVADDTGYRCIVEGAVVDGRVYIDQASAERD